MEGEGSAQRARASKPESQEREESFNLYFKLLRAQKKQHRKLPTETPSQIRSAAVLLISTIWSIHPT